MGFQKIARPVLAPGDRTAPVQSLTGDSTGTELTNQGISTIVVTTGEGTAANLVYTLAPPAWAGQRKQILADLNSTKEVTVRTKTSAATFFGSTKNSFVFSTGSTAPPAHVELIGLSTVQWAIANIASTSVTIAGATA
jgi:hypothetical protein